MNLAIFAFSVLQIILDKIHNFAIQDINGIYSVYLTNLDYDYLCRLEIDDLYNFVNLYKENADKKYLCSKLKINENMYNFMRVLISTTDYSLEHIGIGSSNLFNCL